MKVFLVWVLGMISMPTAYVIGHELFGPGETWGRKARRD